MIWKLFVFLVSITNKTDGVIDITKIWNWNCSENWNCSDNLGITALSNSTMKIHANTGANGEPIATPPFGTYVVPLELKWTSFIKV